MPRKKRDNRWDDIDGGSAFTIPYTLLRHPNFIRLSPFALKLLLDTARQYSGFNNGYLCCSWALMEQQGWKSEETVRKAMKELEHYRILLRTQQGGKNRPNLHALTWRRIDGKPDHRLEVLATAKPTDEWKLEQPDFVRTAGVRKSKKAAKVNLRTVA